MAVRYMSGCTSDIVLRVQESVGFHPKPFTERVPAETVGQVLDSRTPHD